MKLKAVADSKKVKTAGVLFLIVILCSGYVFGCIYNVRDIGFADLEPHPYRLFCFVQDSTPESQIAALEQISYTAFLDTNIKVEIINVDQEKNHPASEHLIFREIESFPAAVLLSPNGKSLVLPISAPPEAFEKTVRSSFHRVISSPIRKKISDRIIKAYCVVLLIKGKNEAENTKVYEIVSRAGGKIAKIMGQLPKRIEEPPHILVMNQELIPEESLLLWSLGLEEIQINTPRVAVIYGRGRRIGPLLAGEAITGDRLYRILSVIGLSCDCGLDKRWMTGLLLPLRWNEKMQSEVVKSLGFDAENPMVKTEMSSILSLDLFKHAEDDEFREELGSILDDYSEGTLEFEADPDAERVSPATLRELTSYETALPRSGLKLKAIVYAMSGLVLLILAGGFIIWIRARRKIS